MIVLATWNSSSLCLGNYPLAFHGILVGLGSPNHPLCKHMTHAQYQGLKEQPASSEVLRIIIQKTQIQIKLKEGSREEKKSRTYKDKNHKVVKVTQRGL